MAKGTQLPRISIIIITITVIIIATTTATATEEKQNLPIHVINVVWSVIGHESVLGKQLSWSKELATSIKEIEEKKCWLLLSSAVL